ncbi:MAG: Crp/Fnr family transcriptional regulator [Clostridiales bacterium]|nr:Crp/Fnr family transcriptional regulator [Clostridiales bacterium]
MYERLKDMPLFRGMSEADIERALRRLDAHERKYKKGEAVLHAGAATRYMGVVLEGSVTVESNDIWGDRMILARIGRGEAFAETYALLADTPLLVDVTANEDASILFLKVGNADIIGHDAAFAANLLSLLANRNLHLSARSFHTAPKTIRERVLSYLNTAALEAGSREFDIPFDRQQLADYLNVERTALSKELGRMRREGYFEVRKNHFALPDSGE